MWRPTSKENWKALSPLSRRWGFSFPGFQNFGIAKAALRIGNSPSDGMWRRHDAAKLESI